MISSFKFESYTIDKFSFDVMPTIGRDVLTQKDFRADNWEFMLGFRPPQYLQSRKTYLGGVELKMRVLNKKSDNPEEELVKLHAGIVGAFKVDKEGLTEEQEQSLVKNQIPAILMPFLRAAVMSFLASSGFGSVVLPLINVHEIAKHKLTNVDVELLD
ncbi:hypothetical protein JCM15519_02960 [Fundidesulfovibrio butyratiphilus]